jgi:exonuclease III
MRRMSDALINDAWRALVRHAQADRNARSYTWWARLNAEPDKTMMMINETLFRAAMREVLDDPELADWKALLAKMDQAGRIQGVSMTLDIDERTADW